MILIIALIFFRDAPGCAVISEHDPSTQSFCMRLVRLVRWLRLFEPFDATIVTIHNILKAVRNVKSSAANGILHFAGGWQVHREGGMEQKYH